MLPAFNHRPLSRTALCLIGLLLLVTVIYRVAASHFEGLGNTAPLMAIAFAGALLLGSRMWWIPVVLLVASDLILGLWHGNGGVGAYTLMSAIFYLAVAATAGRLRLGRWTFTKMWLGTLVCSVLFYLVANTYSWMLWAGYEKSLAGWWQSQTTGVPGVNPPSWMFLRNALIADTVWCVIAGLIVFAERGFASKAVAPRQEAG